MPRVSTTWYATQRSGWLVGLLLITLPSAARGNEGAAGDPVPRHGGDGAPLVLPPPPSVALRYRIEARLSPADKRIRATMALSLRNVSRRPLTELRFHLYLNAFANPRTLFMRSSGGRHRGTRATPTDRGWTRVTRVAVDGEPASARELHDGTVLSVPLPRPLAPGQDVAVALDFVAQLPRIFARTGYAGDFFMLGQWYPKLGFLNDDGSWHCPPFHAHSEFFGRFAQYEVQLTLPAAYKVGATGVQTVRSVSGDQQRLLFVAGPVHDFAFAAWPHFVTTEATHRDVRLRLLSTPGRSHQQPRQVHLLRRGLGMLESWFGAYPYPQLTIVDVPSAAFGARGMEYPNLFTGWMPAWAPPGLHVFDEMLIHELTHQYFQGVVATNEVAEPWLDEGITTYVSAVVLDKLFGANRSFIDLGPIHLGQREKNRLHHLRAKSALAVGRPAAGFDTWTAYTSTVYGRAAALLTTLESLIGQPRLIAALGRYVRTHIWSHPGGADLRKLLVSASPPDTRPVVGALLRAIVDEGGRVDYRIRCDARGIVVERHTPIKLPLVVRWQRADGSTGHRRWNAEQPQLTIEERSIREAQLTPPDRLALDATPLDNACRPRARASGFLRITSVVQLLLQLVGP